MVVNARDPLSSCPHCGKGEAQLIRVLSTEIRSFCESCIDGIAEHTTSPTGANESRMAISDHISSYVAFRRKHVIA